MKKFILFFILFCFTMSAVNAVDDEIEIKYPPNYFSKDENIQTESVNTHLLKVNNNVDNSTLYNSGIRDTRSENEKVLAKNLKVLTKGEGFKYPIKNGAVIECYAKRVDGSIDAFLEYNDYFKMIHGELYSDTMNKLYKNEKGNHWKKVDRAQLLDDGVTLKLYDPLWEGTLRRHLRTVKINTKTGDYYMKGSQDNSMWYRRVVTTGYCHVLNP